MRPKNLQTKIFLDSGDPQKTREALDLIGFLDGQTTNPSLIAKSPKALEKIASGGKFTQSEVMDFYKDAVQEISAMIDGKSVSVEVAADGGTTAQTIIDQAREMNTWIDHVHIKIPITHEGLKAGEILSAEGMRLNYTLNFSQAQAAAVHSATRGADPEHVYISPFHGRLDDLDLRGADVIDHIQKMLADNGSHVQLLVASVRDYETFLYALHKQVDIITVPYAILEKWKECGLEIPSENQDMRIHGEIVETLPYESHDLSAPWDSFDISHPKTDEGLEEFMADWKKIVE